MEKLGGSYWTTSLSEQYLTGEHELEVRAGIALALIERWGPVAATLDGEDSAGRAKMRLQTPEELVRRCFDVAEVFVEHAELNGYIKRFPEPLTQRLETVGRLMGHRHQAEYEVALTRHSATAAEK